MRRVVVAVESRTGIYGRIESARRGCFYGCCCPALRRLRQRVTTAGEKRPPSARSRIDLGIVRNVAVRGWMCWKRGIRMLQSRAELLILKGF